EVVARLVLRLGAVEEVRRRAAQGPVTLRVEVIGALDSARGVKGWFGDGDAALAMVQGGGDHARFALHEDVVGPARANVEELDDVVGRTDRLGLDVRRVPVAGEEALEDGAP